MDAIARVESGYHPWAVRAADGPHYFRSGIEAARFVTARIRAGERNIDLGCMQINWRWHAEAFSSPAAALHPLRNAMYAARYLRELRDRKGSWSAAVAAYHSPTPARQAAYTCRVAAHIHGAELAGC
jgi:soluble lytic murein transglycosylase-like protein